MARWISLSTFNELYSRETDLLSGDSHATFLNRLQSEEGEKIREQKGISQSDFLQFIAAIKSPESIVFHGWVTQSKELQKTLDHGIVSGKFRDDKGILNHTLSSKFQHFISPFLGPILLRNIPDEMRPLSVYFSYCPILDDDTRATVESQLFKPVRAHLSLLTQVDTLSNEQALIDLVTPLCSDVFIESMNYLSKRSYALKMEYVDSVMEVIRTPACTVRFANWILKQMERLELNREHTDKLYDLRKELAAGKLHVKKLESTKSNLRVRPILLGIFTLAVLIFGIYLLIAKPFNEANVYHPYDSANAEFSKEELDRIDSLTEVIERESFMEGRMVDPDIIIQSVSQISLREPFRTSLMEEIFTDLNKDVTLKENYYDDSCGAQQHFQRYPGVKDLAARSASKSVELRNDSDYDLIIYVSNNKKTGAVYSLLVQSGFTASFKMNVNDVLTTVAGNEFVVFVPPVGSFVEEKPSQKFRYHFCDTDNNYFESINTTLVLKSTTRGNIKFLVTGSYGDDYRLVDVYNVAEPF